jgi:signal transduction histidine kinase
MRQPDASPLPVSLFDLLRHRLGASVPVIPCSKATLVHFSHTLEDLVLRHELPAIVFTGFQESSHWRQETARYRALAEVAQQVCIFAGGTLPPESSARQLHVTLRGDDPLRQEWFLGIFSERFTAMLCGQDRLEAHDEEATREFDTIWSLEPAVIAEVLDLLEQVVAHYRPDRLALLQRARQNVVQISPDPALVTELSSELLRYEATLNRRLYRAGKALAQQLEWRERLTETLVHDLRTPLDAVNQTIAFVRRERDLDRATLEEMLDMAAVSIANLSTLVQIIMDTNRLEANQLSLHFVPTTPNRLIERALETTRPLLRLANLTFHMEVDPQVRVLVVDGDVLSRVLQNLISNAVRFTASGGTISLALTAPKPGWIQIRLRDTGIGIAPDVLPHIFERYYRKNSDQLGGGIGLYFCRLAVEAHGGQIRADSQLGVGTTFTITLPSRPD